ncbi:Uncharacterised protein [Vibrio cholerae]|uniref:Uncharacterized protein n=1 Tax=Vibrio cholerae TaxID=666 RepID=A0A656APX0_VIBCL|nr:Uncharacterised protein [Vibrio cholerae]CSD25920.1 Uncharacterised protein [Vibrio cholerae]
MISCGFASAGELIDTLSAPNSKIRAASCADLIPPATQKGMSITSATRATQLLSTTRPSLEAVIS